MRCHSDASVYKFEAHHLFLELLQQVLLENGYAERVILSCRHEGAAEIPDSLIAKGNSLSPFCSVGADPLELLKPPPNVATNPILNDYPACANKSYADALIHPRQSVESEWSLGQHSSQSPRRSVIGPADRCGWFGLDEWNSRTFWVTYGEQRCAGRSLMRVTDGDAPTSGFVS